MSRLRYPVARRGNPRYKMGMLQRADNGEDGKVALWVIVLSSFLAPFMGSCVNVALPAIGRDYALNAVLLGWVATSYLLAAAVALLPSGRLADIVGRRRIFVAGMVIYTLSALMCGLAPSVGVFLVSRIVNGVGGAMSFATGTAILLSIVPPHQRGRALGWNVAAVYLGLSAGPILGGIITHDFGWRWIFHISGGVGIVATVLVMVTLKGEWAEARGERFDAVGAVVSGAALVAIIYGLTRIPDASGTALVVAGGAALALFFWWERRLASPLLNVPLFIRNRAFVFSSLAALINYSALTAVGYLLSLYLQYQKGLSPRQAGLVLVAQPILMATLSPLSGRLSDRIAPNRMASMGMALAVPVLAAFAFLKPDTSLWLLVAGLAVLGVSFAVFSSPNMHAIMSSVERRHYGVASSVLATMRMIGQSLSMGIVTLIVALGMGRVPIRAENYPQFLSCARLSFAVSAVLCSLGVLVSLRSRK